MGEPHEEKTRLAAEPSVPWHGVAGSETGAVWGGSRFACLHSARAPRSVGGFARLYPRARDEAGWPASARLACDLLGCERGPAPAREDVGDQASEVLYHLPSRISQFARKGNFWKTGARIENGWTRPRAVQDRWVRAKKLLGGDENACGGVLRAARLGR